jgi:transposase
MISQDRRTTVRTLRSQGVRFKEIARLAHIDVKTVRTILACPASDAPPARTDKVAVDEGLLAQLHQDCKGYVQRMHELLTEEHGYNIGYSSLTRLVRDAGLGVKRKPRSCHVPDVPGEEMQHDTSEHKVRIAGVQRKVISSGLYLRYSKMRYVLFYRRFNRFTMKCFFDEALRHWGYCAPNCIIDNTHLAILYGSGPSAVMCPEMIGFGNNYGFTWKAHAIGHADRKAGTERNFNTVETSFLPGRSFDSLEDMNAQAIQWATVRYAKRPQAKTKLIPAMLFETEKSSLVKLPEYISAPSAEHHRVVDEYGYVSFDGNFYHVPQSLTKRTVVVVQYAHHLAIMDGITEAVRHAIVADGVKNEKIAEPGHAPLPRYAPKNRKLGCEHEEKNLREMGEVFARYLDMAIKTDSGVRQRPAFIRALYGLSKRLGASLLQRALERAQAYNVFDLGAIERIAAQFIAISVEPDKPDSGGDTAEDYQKRPTYHEGLYTEENPFDYTQLS